MTLNRKLSHLITAYLACFLGATSVANAEDGPDSRVASTGAIFTRETTHPALGNAYRDPSGLIWGDLAIKNNHVQLMNAADAEAYCAAIGARLPSKNEYARFAKYLGADNFNDYSPLSQDGKTQILLGLPYYWYWTSTPYWFGNGFNYIFYGDSGVIQDGNRRSRGGAVHCVVGNSSV